MRLINRKRLLTLMAIQDISQRQLALAAGYKSHAYLGRLMRGEVDTLDPEAALRIARCLQCGVDDLFMPRLSSDVAQSAARRVSAGAA